MNPHTSYYKSPRGHTLTQFDSTQESGVFIQGHAGCGAGNEQLQMVSRFQLDNTCRNTNEFSTELCRGEERNVSSCERCLTCRQRDSPAPKVNLKSPLQLYSKDG